MGRVKGGRSWTAEHATDPYVRAAHRLGLRSRAALKLIELDRRDRLLRPGATVVDLGAAPGGWSQVARDRVGAQGRVIALDILPVEPLSGVEVIEGDFTEDGPLEQLEATLAGDRVDGVLSDMAPNLSGVKAADQARATYLVELALAFARSHLRQGGWMLVKAFQGEGFNELRRDMASTFEKLVVRKPESSRSRSAEVYLLGLGFNV